MKHAPGNPETADKLRGQPLETVAAYCTDVLAANAPFGLGFFTEQEIRVRARRRQRNIELQRQRRDRREDVA